MNYSLGCLACAIEAAPLVSASAMSTFSDSAQPDGRAKLVGFKGDRSYSIARLLATVTLILIWVPKSWPHEFDWARVLPALAVAGACYFLASVTLTFSLLWGVEIGGPERKITSLGWLIRFALTVLLVSACFQAIRTPIPADDPVHCEPNPRGGVVCS